MLEEDDIDMLLSRKEKQKPVKEPVKEVVEQKQKNIYWDYKQNILKSIWSDQSINPLDKWAALTSYIFELYHDKPDKINSSAIQKYLDKQRMYVEKSQMLQKEINDFQQRMFDKIISIDIYE